MENPIKKHIVLKILLALLPALIFMQNYAWMTLNAYLGKAFLIIWALMIWNVWQFTEKNRITERLFRLTEISFFLLPLSAIVFSFVFGSQAMTLTSNEFEQAGAALGTAIGGTFVVILAFIIGLIGGIIMHLITNKYEKKAEASGVKEKETLSSRHGTIITIAIIILLSIIMGVSASSQNAFNAVKEKENLNSSLQQGGTDQDQNVSQSQKVGLEITAKDFKQIDYRDYITMTFKFINNTDKDIKGVEGTITFYDIFDNKISETGLGYDEGIPANESSVWKSGMNYNEFMEENVKLKNTELENLKYKWEVKTIIYSDGTKETF